MRWLFRTLAPPFAPLRLGTEPDHLVVRTRPQRPLRRIELHRTLLAHHQKHNALLRRLVAEIAVVERLRQTGPLKGPAAIAALQQDLEQHPSRQGNNAATGTGQTPCIFLILILQR